MLNRWTCLLKSGVPESFLRNARFLLVKRSSTVTNIKAVSEDWDNAKPFEDIPGPKSLPIIGIAWRFIPPFDLSMDFSKLAGHLHQKYGIISKVPGFPGRPNMVFLCDPNDIETVFRNEGQWPIRDSGQSMIYYRKVKRKDLYEGIGGVIVTQGEEWQTFRSKVNPIMMQPRITKLYVAPIDAVANDFIKRIRLLRDDNQEMPADFNNDLFKWALESVVYITLNKRVGCLSDDLKPDSEPQRMIDAVQVMIETSFKLDVMPSMLKIFTLPAWRKYIKASDCFGEIALKYVNEAKEKFKTLPQDSERELTVVEKLLARDPNPKTAMVMAFDMMFAGVDTTSYSSATLLYFLAKNPDKQQKLYEELRRHLPQNDQPITSEILHELKYLKACIKESMRIQPITLGNLRRLPKDLTLSGYRVPKGTDVVLSNSYLSNVDKYFAQPDKFIPERWLKNTDGAGSDIKMTHPFVFLPFGFGSRMCLGRRFAELEMETLITKIVLNFHIEFNYEMKFKTTILCTPAVPLKFKFVDRT